MGSSSNVRDSHKEQINTEWIKNREFLLLRENQVTEILPDVLPPDLVTLFCGSAASKASAHRHAYYAHPRNRFWPTLHKAGFTDRLLKPEEFHLLPTYGVGLTDLAKYEYGNDDELSPEADDVAGLQQRIRDASPKLVAFNGKRTAKAFLGLHRLDYGEAGEFAGARLFVLPSTSGLATRFWDISCWQKLAELHSQFRNRPPVV